MDDFSNAKGVSRNWSDAQRAAVIKEMNCLLGHPVFKGSNRCVDLLRYLINCALAGADIEIKERTLGIEVFGRSANYDVSTDPIVRRIASEIRKRLAQYYQERGNNYCVRIDLVRGSYLPEFEFASENGRQESKDADESKDTDGFEQSSEPLKLLETEITHLERRSDFASRISRRSWVLGLAAAILVCLAISPLLHVDAFHSPVYRIWKPLLDSSNVITVCLPIHDEPKASGQVPPSQDAAVSTLFRDVSAGTSITAVLSNFKRQTDLRPSTALKFRDLQQNPAVLIGGSNNPWVAMLLSDLRYSLQYDPDTRDAWIQDAQNPAKRDWKIDGKSRSADPSVDYAVITRVFDQKTNQWIMALSGLQAPGTEAASELVANPNYAKLVPTSIREQGNFQIVLKTSIIGGEPGPLEILAVQTW